ncbi:tyrosine-type recombinase/integrase [Actinosynnema pretiosum]|uniref:tyrosine-type recombinase/integrase n=1 Tax=Actinosynnema pretiosum TaxID=42197 RepID=UPI001E64E0C4|nr:tyrosine-type recombinase/integrase [Actinosynnema pretiosum]
MSDVVLVGGAPELRGEGDAGGGPWPGVSDPAALVGEIAEWLAAYGNTATRRTYAEGVGLPVSPNDVREWLDIAEPAWTRAVIRYSAVLQINPAPATGEHRPPPAPRGRLRHLHWFRWCAGLGIDPLTAGSTQVKAWLAQLDAAGAAVATRDRMLATVKALYTHLADVGLAEGNPAALDRRRLGLVAPRGNATSTVTLTIGQVRALYDVARAPRRGASEVDTARAGAVVALFTLGLRVSEICGLDRADLHVNRGRRALRVEGKGGKTRIVYLHSLAETALMGYLRTQESRSKELTRADRRATAHTTPLLTTRTGNRYQRQALWQLLRRLAESGGDALLDVADAMHPHALRHFYVTTAVEAGAELGNVQADVGHSSIDTTSQVYNHAARDPSRSAADLVGQALDAPVRDVW